MQELMQQIAKLWLQAGKAAWEAVNVQMREWETKWESTFPQRCNQALSDSLILDAQNPPRDANPLTPGHTTIGDPTDSRCHREDIRIHNELINSQVHREYPKNRTAMTLYLIQNGRQTAPIHAWWMRLMPCQSNAFKVRPLPSKSYPTRRPGLGSSDHLMTYSCTLNQARITSLGRRNASRM